MTLQRQEGFTLIEVVVAMAILALVSLSFVGTRTGAMMNAKEARNWRLARELADELLSELMAGARDTPPTPGRVESERYKNFSHQILVGEDVIAEFESNENTGWDQDATDRTDRLNWERERDDIRLARQKGMNIQAYRDQKLKEDWQEEQDNKVPNEDDLEDVLVVVYFPNQRLGTQQDNPESSFKLKAKISTLAVEGLTPEEARTLAQAEGREIPASLGGAEAGAAGGAGETGNRGQE